MQNPVVVAAQPTQRAEMYSIDSNVNPSPVIPQERQTHRSLQDVEKTVLFQNVVDGRIETGYDRIISVFQRDMERSHRDVDGARANIIMIVASTRPVRDDEVRSDFCVGFRAVYKGNKTISRMSKNKSRIGL